MNIPPPSLLDRLERKFGPFSLPGLLRIIASFQVICFFLIQFRPDFTDFLALTPAAWQKWEVWRFLTFTFIPSTDSVIFILFALMILILIGDQLEAEWGRFRLNLYYFASIVCLWAAVILAGPVVGGIVGLKSSTLLYSSLLLAFATVVPNYTFLLFFVLPVKVKWLACLSGALLAWQAFSTPVLLLPILLALLPYACFALPLAWRRFRHGARVSSRRARFQAESLPSGPAFHQCRICQQTEVSDPSLEFRISGDGEEYCSKHLP